MAEESHQKPPDLEEDDLGLWDDIEEAEVSILAKVTGIVLGLLAILVVLALCIAVVGVMYRVSTTGEVDPHLNPLNMIFASRAIVGAVRITLLFVAAYIVVSCIGLMWQRRWLISFWPLKAADPVAKSVQMLDEDRAAYDALLADAYQTIETLQESKPGPLGGNHGFGGCLRRGH